jgi:hypothetical protein
MLAVGKSGWHNLAADIQDMFGSFFASRHISPLLSTEREIHWRENLNVETPLYLIIMIYTAPTASRLCMHDQPARSLPRAY